LVAGEMWTWPVSNRPPPHCACMRVLSRTELQARGPAAMAGQRVFNYARTGVNSSERPMRTNLPEKKNSVSETKEKGPHRAPADRVERIQSVSQELREGEHRRSQRPTAACWELSRGDGGAGRLWQR